MFHTINSIRILDIMHSEKGTVYVNILPVMSEVVLRNNNINIQHINNNLYTKITELSLATKVWCKSTTSSTYQGNWNAMVNAVK